MTIKPVYLVTDMDSIPTTDENMTALEYKTERAALKAASEALANTEGQDAEVWVWKLSHVLSKPEVDPVVDRVK